MRIAPFGLLVGALICGATVAEAGALGTNAAPCTRQTAIWDHLFDAPAARQACRPQTNWFTESAPNPEAAVAAPLFAVATPAPSEVVAAQDPAAAASAAAQPPPKAFEYSEAYTTRRKIHYIASFATVPLFVTQWVLGDKLFDRAPGESGGSTKSAHSATAIGIEALFGINTVTGVWNLWEARKDPNGRARRLTHGLMMLGADAGFVATGLLAPDDDEGSGSGRNTHRNVAIGSMAVATVSYAMMLIWR